MSGSLASYRCGGRSFAFSTSPFLPRRPVLLTQISSIRPSLDAACKSRYRIETREPDWRAIMRKALFVFLLLFVARPVFSQGAPEGIWQGYDGEWRHVSSQLLALAEATPEGKFSWR